MADATKGPEETWAESSLRWSKRCLASEAELGALRNTVETLTTTLDLIAAECAPESERERRWAAIARAAVVSVAPVTGINVLCAPQDSAAHVQAFLFLADTGYGVRLSKERAQAVAAELRNLYELSLRARVIVESAEKKTP